MAPANRFSLTASGMTAAGELSAMGGADSGLQPMEVCNTSVKTIAPQIFMPLPWKNSRLLKRTVRIISPLLQVAPHGCATLSQARHAIVAAAPYWHHR